MEECGNFNRFRPQVAERKDSRPGRTIKEMRYSVFVDFALRTGRRYRSTDAEFKGLQTMTIARAKLG